MRADQDDAFTAIRNGLKLLGRDDLIGLLDQSRRQVELDLLERRMNARPTT